MFTNRFSTWTVVLVVIAVALIAMLTVNAYLEQRRGEALTLDQPQNAQVVNPDTYYPLPPGKQKQISLLNAARRACLSPGHSVQVINDYINPDTYYPLPPGKQTALVNAAIQACIDDYLKEWAGK